jgi:hypothetical protein
VSRAAAALLWCLLTLPPPAAGQASPPAGALDRPMTLAPRSGPVGTRVTVRGEEFPSITAVQVAIGGTRSGFEALALTLTSMDGELSETVVVPDWVSPEGTHRVIVFDTWFRNILAMSPLFHVTDAEGRLVRRGEVVRASGGCVELRGEDGGRYLLEGSGSEVRVGARVEVEATVAPASDGGCGDALTLRVLRLRRG